MAKPPKDPDGVGYGRPPPASQFKPGKSGNPKGRPKGSRNFNTVLDEALDERVTVTVNGRSRKLPKRSVIAKQAVHKAASGDLKATSMVWSELHRAQGAQEALAMQSMRPLDANEQEVLAAAIERMRQHLLAQPPAPRPVPPASDSPTSTSDRPTPRKRHVLLVRLDPLQASTGASTYRTP
ncbi:MAG: DUF5681 domain-containing protein [Methylibium sp.]